MPVPQTHPVPPSPWRTFLWAAYLGCSWTWCIGMFLPAILIRDYGPWAFAVFAIPNVLGAAAMGFVLRSRGQSAALVQAHLPIARLFSFVTLAFHIAFAFLVIGPLAALAEMPQALIAASLALVVVSLLRYWKWRDRTPHRAYPLLIAIFLLFSLLQAALWFREGGSAAVPGFEHSGPFPTAADLGAPRLGEPALLWLAPVCVLGFLFCPYLDLTFHRARANLSPSASRAAFGLGFGVLFASMILFTFAYARLFWPRYDVDAAKPPVALVAAVATHMLAQLIAKFSVHNEEFGARPGARAPWSMLPALLLAAGLVLFASRGIANVPPPPALGPGANDTLPWYRVFMSAYGLVFPAYVWLCMLPAWNTPSWRSLRAVEDTSALDPSVIAALKPTSRQIVVWLAACALAAPAFWLGFLEDRPFWLVPGVGVVLAARAFVGHRPAVSSSTAAT